jgi:arylsulfatase
VDALEDLGVLEDTLVFYVIGDNGASAEGTVNGSFSEIFVFNGMSQLETPEFLAAQIDKFGGPEAYNHFAVGWAHAMDTPYQWTKQVASHFGGTRNGTIVHWPNGIEAKGELRSQFHHVIDVAPTVLEAAGIPEPQTVNGVRQTPIEGVSMRYAFDEADAAERRTTQYFEMFCNRGIYHDGWTAVTRHSTPWVMADELPGFDEDVWELYDTTSDWSQAHDLAAEMPEKLAQLKRLWHEEAVKYNVLPLDDRRIERFNSDLAGRPQLVRGGSQLLFADMRRLSEHSVPNIKNKSHSVTAQVQVPDGGAEGVIVSQGGAFAGWVLYANGGRLKYVYNFLGLQQFAVEGASEIPAGEHQVRMEFAYDGGGLAKGGTITLYVDGDRVGEGRVEATVPLIFSGDETCDVGSDTASSVAADYTPETSHFNGKIEWVQIDIDEAAEDLDHVISPEERLRIAMARQ